MRSTAISAQHCFPWGSSWYYHEEIQTSSLESARSGRGHLRPAVNGVIHSGICNRKSNFALTAWNHRYVSLLPIVHDSTCLKQRYSSAMENILQRLLKTSGTDDSELVVVVIAM